MDRKILLGAADLGRWQSEEFVRAVLISDVFHSKVQQGARTTLSASSQNLFTLGGGGWWHLCFLELCFAAGSLTLPQRRMTSEKDDLPATSSGSHICLSHPLQSARHSCSQVGSQNLFSFRHFLNSQSPNPEP